MGVFGTTPPIGSEPGMRATTRLVAAGEAKEDLGGGLGVLNFSRDAIERLIDKGYEDTLRHDCVRSGCVLPA